MTSPSGGGGRLAALMLAAFVDTLGAFLVLALLPFYALEMGATPLEVGFLVSAFSIAQTVSAPIWGKLSDQVGRRPVILLGLAVSVLAYVAFGLASSLAVLLASRLAQGLGGGTVSVVFAYIADSVPVQQRAERIGWVTSATSAAAMVGPAVGSLAARYDPAFPGFVVAGLALSALVVALFALPEPAKSGGHGAQGPSLAAALGRVVAKPGERVHRLIWIYTVAMLASNGATAIAGLYLAERFDATEATVWPFFTFLAFVSLLVRALFLGPAVRRLGEVRVLRAGAASLAIGLAMMPVPATALALAAPIVLFALGTSFLYPCTTALVSRYAPRPERVGETLGVQQAFGGMARIAGPIAAGAVFEAGSVAAPFVLGAALMLGVLGMAVVGLRGAEAGAGDASR